MAPSLICPMPCRTSCRKATPGRYIHQSMAICFHRQPPFILFTPQALTQLPLPWHPVPIFGLKTLSLPPQSSEFLPGTLSPKTHNLRERCALMCMSSSSRYTLNLLSAFQNNSVGCYLIACAVIPLFLWGLVPRP